MSTVIARSVASSPVRTAAQTWAKIVEIIAPDPQSAARKELAKAEGVACASISAEATKDAAMVVWGGGPRVRVYCVFDDDAVTRDDVNEDALPKSPTDGEWKMSIPCLQEDVEWCRANLAAVSSKISARIVDDDVEDGDEQHQAAKAAPAMGINMQEFMKS